MTFQNVKSYRKEQRMKSLIENTILIIAVIILSTFMITSIENADTHFDEPLSKEEKMRVYHQYLDYIEGRN